MNTGARLGLTVAAGYLLGRFHKMKWALAVAAIASRGRLPSGPSGLLQQGVKALSSSPELAELTDEMKGRLVDAGKAAAVAAVSSKINSLTDGLRERSDAMRAASAGGDGRAEEEDIEEDVEDERHRDEDRAADSGRKRQPDEDDDSRVPVQRRPGSRGEPERAHAGRQSRGREDTAGQGRASHPSRHSGDGDRARSGAGVRQRQDDRRARPRSSASRTGGDSE